MIKDLILKNRSYRRFYQDTPVAMETLRELIALARLSASGANKQPLKSGRYILSLEELLIPNYTSKRNISRRKKQAQRLIKQF